MKFNQNSHELLESGMLTEEFTSIRSLIRHDQIRYCRPKNVDPIKIKKVKHRKTERPYTKVDRIKKIEGLSFQ